MSILDLLDEPRITPHPALVAAQRPSPREVAQAASVLGWLPDVPYLNPAVPFRREEDRDGDRMQRVQDAGTPGERVHLR